MLERYAFYDALKILMGEEKAKHFVRTYFRNLAAHKIVSRSIIDAAEEDIREYIGAELYGPCFKPFVQDKEYQGDKIMLIYSGLVPLEHVKAP